MPDPNDPAHNYRLRHDHGYWAASLADDALLTECHRLLALDPAGKIDQSRRACVLDEARKRGLDGRIAWPAHWNPAGHELHGPGATKPGDA